MAAHDFALRLVFQQNQDGDKAVPGASRFLSNQGIHDGLSRQRKPAKQESNRSKRHIDDYESVI
jgi:hypothetical protein